MLCTTISALTPINGHTPKQNNNMIPKMVHQPKYKKKLICKKQIARIQVQKYKKHETAQNMQNENYENT
jgi:PPE-repeat protein